MEVLPIPRQRLQGLQEHSSSSGLTCTSGIPWHAPQFGPSNKSLKLLTGRSKMHLHSLAEHDSGLISVDILARNQLQQWTAISEVSLRFLLQWQLVPVAPDEIQWFRRFFQPSAFPSHLQKKSSAVINEGNQHSRHAAPGKWGASQKIHPLSKTLFVEFISLTFPQQLWRQTQLTV